MRVSPLWAKAAGLGAVMLGLLMALQSVSVLVAEREGRLREAERDVAASLASEQTLMGPALQRRCEETWESTQGTGAEQRTVTEQRAFALRLAPKSLVIGGGANIETRHRGLFKVNGYASKLTLSADWADLKGLKAPAPDHAGGQVSCEPPELFVALSDVRGIRLAAVQAGGQPLEVLPGSGHSTSPAGFRTLLPAGAIEAGTWQAEVRLELLGTGSLSFTPVADQTRVQIRSDWPHPSFGGRFLPAERVVDDTGFQALWSISSLATSAPRQLVQGASPCMLDGSEQAMSVAPGKPASCVETFGVQFFDPVSPYVLSDRATKYGLLFIALTFVGVGLVEVLRQLRVHPIQYLLVGGGIAVFFLLLVSLTEHLPFGVSYAVASAACTLLLGFYGSFVLRGVKAGVAFGAGIAALYGALYVLLLQEQAALVVGSIGIFLTLAAIMAATRRIDWYALMQQMSSTAARPARDDEATQTQWQA
jgi:inner membrane protein